MYASLRIKTCQGRAVHLTSIYSTTLHQTLALFTLSDKDSFYLCQHMSLTGITACCGDAAKACQVDMVNSRSLSSPSFYGVKILQTSDCCPKKKSRPLSTVLDSYNIGNKICSNGKCLR